MKKFRNYAFLLGVCVAVVSALVAIGNAFNFKVNEVAISSVLTAILGVLVALGIVVKEPENEEIKIDPNKEDESISNGDIEVLNKDKEA